MDNSLIIIKILFFIFLPYTLHAQISGIDDSICQGIDNDFDCAKEIESIKLREYHSSARRTNDSLILQEKNYRKIVLIDNNSNSIDSTIFYCFIGFIESKHMFVVYSQYFEGGNIMLINSKNGVKINVPSLPIFSPDSTLFAAFNLGLGNFNDENLIEIWRISNKNWVQEYRYSNKDASGPLSIKWVNNDTVIVELGKYNEEQSEVTFFKTSKLIKTNTSWTFDNNE